MVYPQSSYSYIYVAIYIAKNNKTLSVEEESLWPMVYNIVYIVVLIASYV